MDRLKKVFALNRKGFNLPRGLVGLGIFLLPLAVLLPLGWQHYYLSVAFGAAMTAISDPGGSYSHRLTHLGIVTVSGALLTALAFALGPGPWGWIALAIFGVTLLAGLLVRFGRHRFFAAYLVNVWLIIAIGLPAVYALEGVHNNPWGQALGWLGGSLAWIACAGIVWLARGRKPQPAFVPEVPGDVTAVKLTRPVVLFSLIRALAVGLATAIAFGLHLPNDAYWMPLSTLVAMKSSLRQSELVAAQRLIGATLGAALAIPVLLALSSKPALVLIMAFLGGLAASIRMVNYALYYVALSAVVLIADDVPHPTNLSQEGQRVLYTLVGVAIAAGVALLANRMQKRAARKAS